MLVIYDCRTCDICGKVLADKSTMLGTKKLMPTKIRKRTRRRRPTSTRKNYRAYQLILTYVVAEFFPGQNNESLCDITYLLRKLFY